MQCCYIASLGISITYFMYVACMRTILTGVRTNIRNTTIDVKKNIFYFLAPGCLGDGFHASHQSSDASTQPSGTSISLYSQLQTDYLAETEQGLNLWPVTRPVPTRPGRFCLCFELRDYFDDGACATSECFLPKVSGYMQHTYHLQLRNQLLPQRFFSQHWRFYRNPVR